MPTKAQITQNVIRSVSKYSGVREQYIRGTMVLVDSPLRYEDIGFNSLTLSLRAYIQYNKPNNTILLKEIKKTGQTVDGLIAIVTSRV